MSFTLISIRDILILVLALTIDTFAVSFFYGSSKIKIPFLSVIIINAICSSILAVSLLLGYLLRTIIPENVTKWACFFILFLLGIFKLCDSYLKIFMQKHADLSKNFLVSFSGICFALSIYADPEKADIDSSHDISPEIGRASCRERVSPPV